MNITQAASITDAGQKQLLPLPEGRMNDNTEDYACLETELWFTLTKENFSLEISNTRDNLSLRTVVTLTPSGLLRRGGVKIDQRERLEDNSWDQK